MKLPVQLSENKYNSYGTRIDTISFDIFGSDLNVFGSSHPHNIPFSNNEHLIL